MDVSPLRESRDFRLIFSGQAVSVLGNQLTQVAVPFQVYSLTRSSFDVGLVSLIQLFPLLTLSLFGGSVIDAVDRRRLLIAVEAVMACSSAGMAINTDLGPHLWVLFVLPAVSAGLQGVDTPTRNAMIPNLVPVARIPSGTALFQVLNQFGSVAGPAAGGLLLAGPGLKFVFWVDVASFVVSIAAASAMSPQPPKVVGQRPGFRSVAEGLRFVRQHQALQGAYLIDINAMVFGMPRALFPALALHHFGGGASVVGFLYAGPGFGAFFGALTTGWVSRVRRQGVVVTLAVLIWGCAIAAFGLVSWLPLALVLLAVAGWADVISALFRNMIIQFSTPDRMRGRLLGLQIGVVAGGPRLGDLEAGSVATLFGDQFSVVSGGVACVVGALALVRLLPEFRRVELRPGQTPGDEVREGPTGEPEPAAGLVDEPADEPVAD